MGRDRHPRLIRRLLVAHVLGSYLVAAGGVRLLKSNVGAGTVSFVLLAPISIWLNFAALFAGMATGSDAKGIAAMCAMYVVAVLLLVRLSSDGRRRVARTGVVPRCARCGYDLRATPSRYPECGAVVHQ